MFVVIWANIYCCYLSFFIFLFFFINFIKGIKDYVWRGRINFEIILRPQYFYNKSYGKVVIGG